MYCKKCKQEINQEAQFCPCCGTRTGVSDKPMKWFKFIIYFQLFITALVDFRNAGYYFTGLIYGDFETAKAVYTKFSSMRQVDIAFGILSIGLIILALYARSRLAHFHANGPKVYFYYLIFTNLPTILYPLLTSITTGIAFSELVSADIGTSVGGVIAMLIWNVQYFNERKHLFTNP